MNESYHVQFSRLSYYEHIEIIHLFDTMHIGKNVIETLWKSLLSPNIVSLPLNWGILD
jgi:hypothetical protein